MWRHPNPPVVPRPHACPAPLCRSGRPFEYTLLLAPRRTKVAERLLEEAGLLGDVTLRDYPLDWVALDEDLLSLEMPLAFKVGEDAALLMRCRSVQRF